MVAMHNAICSVEVNRHVQLAIVYYTMINLSHLLVPVAAMCVHALFNSGRASGMNTNWTTR